jgi:hypothetical protein
LRRVNAKYNRVILAALALLLLTGCVTQVPTAERAAQAAPTATPMPTATLAGPMPTYANPNLQHVVAANTLYALELEATAQAINRAATEGAATQAAVDRAAAIAAATQQAEQFDAQATASALDLLRAEQAITQTAIAIARDNVVATQEAARAKELETEAQETERRASQADLDRQTWYVVKLALGLATLALGLMAGWQLIRLLSVYVAIKARRMLVMEQAGLFIDAQTGRPEALPAYTPAPALPAPGQIERLQAAISPELREDALRASDRELRRAWRTMALHFLRWSEYIPKGEDTPLGFSRRRLCAAANVSRDTYETMIAFLADLGLIQKETDHPRASWILARGSDGLPITVSQALRHTVWLTSFDTPDVPSLPLIYAPPQNARPGPSHPIPPTPTQPSPHPPTKNGENAGKTAPNTWNMSLDYGPDDVPEAG